MLPLRVCAANMGGFLGTKFSKPGPLSSRFSLTMTWVALAENSPKFVQDGYFSVEIHQKSRSEGQVLVIRSGQLAFSYVCKDHI